MRRNQLVRRGDGHETLDPQSISLAAKGDEGVGLLGKDAGLLRFSPRIDLDEQTRTLADPVDLAGERRCDFLTVDGLNHVESLHRLARLIALQGPDRRKLDRLAERGGARPQVAPFGDCLLHTILTEASLADALDRRP